jgi:flagellar biosynthetic protein FliR
MTFPIENIEIFLLVLVRITAFVYVAPFFSLKDVPQKVKVGFSLFFALILYQTMPEATIEYESVIGYASIVVTEAIVGVVIGFFANISYYILAFAGGLMDMEIGFSMVNELDPVSNIQTTITANFYSYLVMLMMLATNLHHYLIIAMADTFKVIPVGGANLRPSMYLLMLQFIREYFIIGFRILLPIFAAMLLLNSILAILAKVAPQMNMFVIGMQLKVLVGLIILFLLTGFIPVVSSFIFDEMMYMMKSAIEAFT